MKSAVHDHPRLLAGILGLEDVGTSGEVEDGGCCRYFLVRRGKAHHLELADVELSVVIVMDGFIARNAVSSTSPVDLDPLSSSSPVSTRLEL
jgi:hypothetical protein